MSRSCIIKGCPSVHVEYGSEEKITFLQLKRSDPSIYDYWIKVISVHNGQDVSNHKKSAMICSKHFTKDSFTAGFNHHLKSYAIPSIFPESDETKKFEIENIPKPQNSMEFIIPAQETLIRRKRIFFPGDINENLQIDTPSTLVKCIRILKKEHVQNKLKIKRIEAQNRRQKETIKKLKLMYNSLKQRVLSNKGAEDIDTDDHSYSKRVQLDPITTTQIITKANNIMSAAVHEFNKLPKDMKNLKSISIFTRQLKQLIIDNKRAIT